MKNVFVLLFNLVAFFAVIGCVESASDQDVEQMCKTLTQLRSSGGEPDAAADADAMTKCKADPMVKNSSKAVATCRIAAKDIDTFWNKCK